MDADPPLVPGDDLADAIVNNAAVTAAELGPTPHSRDCYCFLCKYGGTDGTNTNVNQEAKKIEDNISHLRKSLGIYKTAQVIKDLYEEHVAPNAPFDQEGEWELDTIVEHIASHAVPESTKRGENAAEIAYEVFSGLLLFQSKHMVDEHTGLLDQTSLKSLCAIADRMYKFQPKSKAIVGAASSGTRKRDDDF